MTQNIDDLLHRRTDLSTFFVHFTQGDDLDSAQRVLQNILREGEIEARNNFGMAKAFANSFPEKLEEAKLEQKVCCFTETPLEHAWMMVEDIAHRSCKFKPYGIVFSKEFGISQGLNPVWYLNIKRGTNYLTAPITRMVKKCWEYLEEKDNVLEVELDNFGTPIPLQARFEVLRITPFIEQVGDTTNGTKDFSWEREWRKVGPLPFRPEDVVAVLAPEARHDSLRKEIAEIPPGWKKREVPILDPKWGLERMILALSGSKL